MVGLTASADATQLSTGVLFLFIHVLDETMCEDCSFPNHTWEAWYSDFDGGVDISESDSGKTRR